MYQEAQKINKTFFFNEELYNRLGIAAIDYELSVDIKLMLNLLGKQSTSSRYSFCLDCDPWLDPNAPPLLRIGIIWENYPAYEAADAVRRKRVLN